MTGIIKFTASIAVILVAGLATLLVFDIIPPEYFSNAVRRIVLTGAIGVLTALAIAFIMRLGK